MRWRYLAVAAVNHPSGKGTLLAPKKYRFSLESAAHFFIYITWFGISIDYFCHYSKSLVFLHSWIH
jgi:hypothetical protein